MEVKIEQNLINFKLDSKTRSALFGMIGIGVLSLLIGYFTLSHTPPRHEGGHSNPAWSAFLIGTFFITGISLAGVFLPRSVISLEHIGPLQFVESQKDTDYFCRWSGCCY